MDIKYIWKTKEATSFAEYKFWDLLLNSFRRLEFETKWSQCEHMLQQ